MVRGEETVLADAANPQELFATANLRTMCVLRCRQQLHAPPYWLVKMCLLIRQNLRVIVISLLPCIYI